MTDAEFEAFYERHWKYVYRLCYTYMKSSAEAEDCTEDVFVKVLTGGFRFNDETHERKWLTVTAINLCKDRLKSWKHEAVTPLDDEPEPAVPEPEDHSDVLEAVQSLPVKYKDVIWLYYYEGYQTEPNEGRTQAAERQIRRRIRMSENNSIRMYGSKYYLEQLSDEERSKIIADINFDVIGGNHLSVGTVNGFENALSIYLERLAKVESDLSDKGSSSDSDPFMHWQIPAVTYIDLSLPIDPCENSSYIDHVSDESFETLASQLANIINGFDIDEFIAMKNSQIKTDYNGKNIDNIYKAMANISIKGFRTAKLYTAVYENGISSCFCCDYASEVSQKKVLFR